MEPTSKRPKRSTTGLSSARIFNSDSPVTKKDTDIQSFLSICLLNWSDYSEEQKEIIISTLPTEYRKTEYDEHGKIICPISPDFVANDKVVRDQIARFKRDVTDGYYTKTWQERARKAMEERADRKFENYLTKHAAEMFTDEYEDDQGENTVPDDSEYGAKPRGKKERRRGKGGAGGKQANRISRASATMYDVENDKHDDTSVDELA